MSSLDVELWNTLLSSVFIPAETQGVTRLEILKRVANDMAGELYVFIATTELRYS